MLDLLRVGIPGGPEHLPLGLIYLHLRQRLQARGLPTPNQRGTDTADRYIFARNHSFARNDAIRDGRQMDVVGVRVEEPSEKPILLFREKEGGRYLPIWVGTVEATTITLIQQGTKTAVPLTYQLFCNALEALGIEMKAASITALIDGVYVAFITLNGVDIRARPSDAAALAMSTGAPILASEAVLDEAGLILPDEDV